MAEREFILKQNVSDIKRIIDSDGSGHPNDKEEKIRSAGSTFEGCLCLSIFYSIFAVISVSKLDQSIYSFKTGIL